MSDEEVEVVLASDVRKVADAAFGRGFRRGLETIIESRHLIVLLLAGHGDDVVKAFRKWIEESSVMNSDVLRGFDSVDTVTGHHHSDATQ